VINILTVEREYGCGGGEIARRVADRLGWTLWDQRLTSEIARMAKCEPVQVKAREERVDPLYYRLLKSILRGSFEGSLNADRLQLLDADSVFRLTERLVQQAAASGQCVIVGRGSQHFLRERADTLRVFLYAPRDNKIRRLVASGVSDAEVEQLVDTVDSERAAFADKYLKIRWPNRPVYHAMFNTAIGDDAVIEGILNLKTVLEEAGRTNGTKGRSAEPETR
jgi:cytidylate kinase